MTLFLLVRYFSETFSEVACVHESKPCLWTNWSLCKYDLFWSRRNSAVFLWTKWFLDFKWNKNLEIWYNQYKLNILRGVKPTAHITGGPFDWNDLTLIIAWISTSIIKSGMKLLIHSKLQRWTVEVWEWISDFIQHFIGHVITYPWWN